MQRQNEVKKSDVENIIEAYQKRRGKFKRALKNDHPAIIAIKTLLATTEDDFLDDKTMVNLLTSFIDNPIHKGKASDDAYQAILTLLVKAKTHHQEELDPKLIVALQEKLTLEFVDIDQHSLESFITLLFENFQAENLLQQDVETDSFLQELAYKPEGLNNNNNDPAPPAPTPPTNKETTKKVPSKRKTHTKAAEAKEIEFQALTQTLVNLRAELAQTKSDKALQATESDNLRRQLQESNAQVEEQQNSIAQLDNHLEKIQLALVQRHDMIIKKTSQLNELRAFTHEQEDLIAQQEKALVLLKKSFVELSDAFNDLTLQGLLLIKNYSSSLSTSCLLLKKSVSKAPDGFFKKDPAQEFRTKAQQELKQKNGSIYELIEKSTPMMQTSINEFIDIKGKGMRTIDDIEAMKLPATIITTPASLTPTQDEEMPMPIPNHPPTKQTSNRLAALTTAKTQDTSAAPAPASPPPPAPAFAPQTKKASCSSTSNLGHTTPKSPSTNKGTSAPLNKPGASQETLMDSIKKGQSTLKKTTPPMRKTADEPLNHASPLAKSLSSQIAKVNKDRAAREAATAAARQEKREETNNLQAALSAQLRIIRNATAGDDYDAWSDEDCGLHSNN